MKAQEKARDDFRESLDAIAASVDKMSQAVQGGRVSRYQNPESKRN